MLWNAASKVTGMAFPFVASNKLAANAVITKPNYLSDGFREFLFQSLDSQIPLLSVNKEDRFRYSYNF